MGPDQALLYIVATPIGNLSDMVPRAVEVLQCADLVAAEDTRHSQRLFSHFAIDTPLIAYHDHSDEKRTEQILQRLESGQTVALISDAGTPLISDPGYRLVREARRRGIRVVPIPGPCALIAALSAAGLPSDRFSFEGFLPAKPVARQKALQALASESRTMVFYEAPHRVVETLEAMVAVFGGDREAVIARELTKAFETFHSAPLSELAAWVGDDSNQQRGEIVLLVRGAERRRGDEEVDAEAERVMKLLLGELPPKKAAALAAEITGINKKVLYKWSLASKGE
ncbi:16S rRNA (cytidine(1402)-2'-O)-methyltransferase [Microbulbifer thermotolerans]|uniref:16S rRNA (cytidine(1402)-2'-O)-methyltransferase n=1 Tax=Microbulbifer thermotolerans TaxID=252514 RepID=UPI00224924AC|nr:16S rRNA (cytidine(1402)-2'-O)-methyltransferase [Microbulbifer thermotolerans]MCX2780758.1 16S rRNA (cytidine(1402)-2'-O)-methyltransferase [Microbulbifer thermotolerans]MCX2793889.1 16S rRNA (cytidine(1402)-2'-O)-methyltransferase [Microbulbifer thermotolerans]MCX2806443.1 16S rRNA (cytidine(1402)-2'-O)-methyltransferase [Microbulbifer thermotolerans]WKT61605.1 16S rRNA (cytidine(1402)-2'-O)-methyltransferase [Microbulbifer thermotolerans]